MIIEITEYYTYMIYYNIISKYDNYDLDNFYSDGFKHVFEMKKEDYMKQKLLIYCNIFVDTVVYSPFLF